MSKKILVIYAPGGNGHKSAAGMIKETFSRKYPEDEIIVVNAIEWGNQFLKFALGIYDTILRTDPKYIKYGFNILNNLKTDKSLTLVFPKTIDMVADKIKEVNPDLIVSVHSGVNYFVGEALRKLDLLHKVPFMIVCTDLTDNFLNSWVNPEADMMVGFLDITKKQLVEYGMAESKVKVLGGPPVNPLFSDNTLSKLEARKKFGLQEDVFTVFIISGGIGLKSIHTFTKQLVNSNLPVQVVVCCGKNEKLKAKLDKLAETSNKMVKVFGFTNQIHNIMDASDLIVTKPGPGVIAEAIVKELPIVLDTLSEVMPQEGGNVDYVIENGVGRKVSEMSKFHNLIASFIYNKEEMEKMRANMKRLKQTESSGLLIDWIKQVAEEGSVDNLLRPQESKQIKQNIIK